MQRPWHSKQYFFIIALLIFLKGDTSAGWQSAAEEWAQQYPHIKFILPTAPRRPVTLNGGMPMPAWYDIVVSC